VPSDMAHVGAARAAQSEETRSHDDSEKSTSFLFHEVIVKYWVLN